MMVKYAFANIPRTRFPRVGGKIMLRMRCPRTALARRLLHVLTLGRVIFDLRTETIGTWENTRFDSERQAVTATFRQTPTRLIRWNELPSEREYKLEITADNRSAAVVLARVHNWLSWAMRSFSDDMGHA